MARRAELSLFVATGKAPFRAFRHALFYAKQVFSRAEVAWYKQQVEGVIGVKAHHFTPAEEKYKVEKYMSLFVDIGAKSKQEVLDLGIEVGSPVIYRPKYQPLLKTRVLANFCDNRSGCATLLALSDLLKGNPQPSTVYLVGTVQEEYNLRGAMMASRNFSSSRAIVDRTGDTKHPRFCGSEAGVFLCNLLQKRRSKQR